MAHFRATIKGNKGEASRCGSKVTGLTVTVRGWNAGLTIRAYYNEELQKDVFEIASDGGTNSAEKGAIMLDGQCDAQIREVK